MTKKRLTFLFALISFQIIYSQANYDVIISGLNLPTVFSFMPGDRIIVNQKGDSTKIFNFSNGQLLSCFWNFKDSLYVNPETGLIGVCLDPNFNSNHYVYIYYTQTDSTLNIIRLTENNNLGTNPVKIFKYKRPGTSWQGPHVAGNIRFGPMGKLFFTVGDAGEGSNAQLLSNPMGKILRINPDGTIPTDNPFYDDGNPTTGNDDRIWAYGFRNPWDFTINPYNDSIYLTENGQTANDEINFVRKGKNYGWPVCQGYCNPYNPQFRQPMDTIGGNGTFNYAPTGILVYNGAIYSSLTGKLVTSNIQNNSPVKGILKYNFGNAPFNDTITSHQVISNLLGTTLLQHTDGYIYLCRLTSGQIVKLLPDPLSVQNINHPSEYFLEQNFPNPFNPVTSIKYSIPKQEFVSVKIFDLLGREIAALVSETKQAGTYEVNWDAKEYPSGIYIYKLTTEDYTEQKKMVLIK